MASKKTKRHMPATMQDLVDTYYNESRVEDRRKHTQFVQDMLATSYESDVRRISVVPLEKIPEEDNVKLPDFIGCDKALVIEVTTMKSGFDAFNQLDSNGLDYPLKMRSAIGHATEKNLDYVEKKYSLAPGYRYVLVVYVDIILGLLGRFWERIPTDEIQKAVREGLLDGIILVSQPASVVGGDSDQRFPPLGYFGKKVGEGWLAAHVKGVAIYHVDR